ncbi:DUF4369 domain-containing protein [Sphingobacterium sp. IITKGP-BTPF85]|uniref:DUF4369 domain-containing protein n=1 Tax=Sphingobacterium sp. IITKGP-BTPF85 TaxID=1338009 RepID=UPI00038A21D3|nr:DUF4369 domain-containing protein [Sphingobacterium sp. IITKGP-BTPF85]KKX47972.1 hypothetical protein L950_0223580 [Sphingobacterium sp. IITKGP-BTPF85]
MKKYLLLLFTVLSFANVMAQKNTDVSFQLQGIVNIPTYDSTNRMIYLTYQSKGQAVLDSTVIKNNKFHFKSTADVDVRATLQFTKPNTSPNALADPNSLYLYLSQSIVNINAKGYLRKAIITGSTTNDDYMVFKKPYLKIDTALRLLGWEKRRVKPEDTNQSKIVDAKIDSVKNSKLAKLSEFLSTHITKPYAAEALQMYVSTDGSAFDLDKAQLFFDQLPKKQKIAVLGKDITASLIKLKQKIVTINILKNVDFLMAMPKLLPILFLEV